MVIKTSEELRELSIMIFKKAGVVDSAAKRITEHLVNSNLVGMDSHGVIRIPDYIQWIKEGIIDLKAQMKIINETFIITVIDGHFSFGQVVMYKACEIAIMRAKEYGISLTTIRNVSHIGRLGEYAEKIANERMVCMIAVNGQGAGQYVAPYGGISRRLSVNPLAWGIPTGIKEKPLVWYTISKAMQEKQ